jgi:hypothetical protein
MYMSMQIMIPCKGRGTWSLYVLDLEEKCVHIMDPMLVQFRAEDLWGLHNPFIQRILDALGRCAEEFLPGWDDIFGEFRNTTIKFDHEPADW